MGIKQAQNLADLERLRFDTIYYQYADLCSGFAVCFSCNQDSNDQKDTMTR
jgi:hypothetical protein